MSDGKPRVYWIDFAKLVAIIAVLVDHTWNILYTNPLIANYSHFSVCVFILVMGVTSYWSFNKQCGNVLSRVLKGCRKILYPYIVSTLIYGIVMDQHFNFALFIDRLIHFNATLPFYYVLLYTQLLFVVPILYYLLQTASKSKYEFCIELLTFIVVFIIGGLTTIFSNILDIYGGGGKLIGGTYLVLLYIGMLYAKHQDQIHLYRFPASFIVFLLLSTGIYAWAKYIMSTSQSSSCLNIYFGFNLNPPSISLIVYALLIFLAINFFSVLIQPISIIHKTFELSSNLGKHTLYIFLYHKLFLDYVFPDMKYRVSFISLNPWIARITCFFMMICGPLIIEYALKKMHGLVKIAYSQA